MGNSGLYGEPIGGSDFQVERLYKNMPDSMVHLRDLIIGWGPWLAPGTRIPELGFVVQVITRQNCLKLTFTALRYRCFIYFQNKPRVINAGE